MGKKRHNKTSEANDNFFLFFECFWKWARRHLCRLHRWRRRAVASCLLANTRNIMRLTIDYLICRVECYSKLNEWVLRASSSLTWFLFRFCRSANKPTINTSNLWSHKHTQPVIFRSRILSFSIQNFRRLSFSSSLRFSSSACPHGSIGLSVCIDFVIVDAVFSDR